MRDSEHAFEFEFSPGKIVCEPGAVAGIADELERRGLERALVVCGSTVGSTPAVVDPVREGVGDRLAGVFAETTPRKYLGTAVEGAERADEVDADALVALGGGSSLDAAKVVAALRSHDRPAERVAAGAIERGSLSTSTDRAPTPIVAIPTTLAGADLSTGAGVTLAMGPEDDPDGEAPGGGVGDGRLMPTALFYDAELFATTPAPVLAASAMNGFDKGVEALYTRNATPITDGTAMRGLRLLRTSLPALGDRSGGMEGAGTEDDADDPPGDDPIAQAVAGTVLVQYGVSTPGRPKLSIVHAFGHGLTEHYDVHQGRAHAAVVPHVLRYLFDNADARRGLLAEALGADAGGETGADADDELAAGVVVAVAGIRDELGLPARLRELDGVRREALPAVAETVAEDALMETVPVGVDPTVAELTAILEAAW